MCFFFPQRLAIFGIAVRGGGGGARVAGEVVPREAGEAGGRAGGGRKEVTALGHGSKVSPALLCPLTPWFLGRRAVGSVRRVPETGTETARFEPKRCRLCRFSCFSSIV